MQPGSIAKVAPHGPDYLVRRMADLERAVNELRNAPTLNAATIDEGGIKLANGGSITADGGQIASADYDCGVDTNTPGTVGWALGGPAGNAVFNPLTLWDGIIGDGTLANPVWPGYADGSGNLHVVAIIVFLR